MTKKDFEFIARVLCNHKPAGLDRDPCPLHEDEILWDNLVDAFAATLKDTNPRFDSEKFKKACWQTY